MKTTTDIHWFDDEGTEQTVEGETLEELATGLEAAGYTGDSIRVTDEPGFTRGWVSAGQWRTS